MASARTTTRRAKRSPAVEATMLRASCTIIGGKNGIAMLAGRAVDAIGVRSGRVRAVKPNGVRIRLVCRHRERQE